MGRTSVVEQKEQYMERQREYTRLMPTFATEQCANIGRPISAITKFPASWDGDLGNLGHSWPVHSDLANISTAMHYTGGPTPFSY